MTAAIDADRRQLAAYLTRNGVTSGEALRLALAWERKRFWDAIYAEKQGWFILTAGGWEMTEWGRIEAIA